LIEENSGGFDNSSWGEGDFEFPILFATNNPPQVHLEFFFFNFSSIAPIALFKTTAANPLERNDK